MLDLASRRTTKEPLNHNEFVLVQAIGAEVCAKIKQVYPTKTWFEVANVFTGLKDHMRKFYSGIGEVQMHKELRKYSLDDIREALNFSSNERSDQGGYHPTT